MNSLLKSKGHLAVEDYYICWNAKYPTSRCLFVERVKVVDKFRWVWLFSRWNSNLLGNPPLRIYTYVDVEELTSVVLFCQPCKSGSFWRVDCYIYQNDINLSIFYLNVNDLGIKLYHHTHKSDNLRWNIDLEGIYSAEFTTDVEEALKSTSRCLFVRRRKVEHL